MTNIHERFQQFLKHNLCAIDKISKLPFYKLYQEFSKLKWNEQNTLLAHPDKIPENAQHFLNIIDEAENKIIKWFIVNRQIGLSDSNFQRALNLFKTKYLYVNVPQTDEKVDLGIINYLQRLNKYQLELRVPQPRPIISMHTARLMRELHLLKKNRKTKYRLQTDNEQIKSILKIWFENNYTLSGEGIGYARRQLLEEANDYLVSKFGDSKLVYCHDPSWTWLMQEVIGMNDQGQKGMYLRLPIWRKGTSGQAIPNERKSVGTGGAYTLEQRQKNRLKNRAATAREKDAARKAREKKRKRESEAL
ncbi:MAG: hypothetical protein CMH46_00680 [Muricauda sp.]|nr:hypothetical protein [Allomuricauda sp.]MAU14039.1 hypothetical protein [Allomuricauda sp.]